MNRHLIIIGIAILLVTIGLSGCNELSNLDEDKFVGTWKYFDNPSLTFFSDGTGSMYGQSVTWELKDGKFVTYLLYSWGSKKTVYDCSFSDDGNKLTLTTMHSGNSRMYTKQ